MKDFRFAKQEEYLMRFEREYNTCEPYYLKDFKPYVAISVTTMGTLWTISYIAVHTTWKTSKEPKIDMPISPRKAVSNKVF